MERVTQKLRGGKGRKEGKEEREGRKGKEGMENECGAVASDPGK